MKLISPRPVFTFSLLFTTNTNTAPALFKISQHLFFSSLTPQNPVSTYHHRRHEEESRNVRVSVWWDFENCNLPCNANVFRVAQYITNAIRANGIKGPIQITAFGDVMQISRTNQEALSSTGINLTHVPAGGRNSADRSLLVDLMYWVSQNPPPAHLFLISGDRDFAGILHRLRMNNYNILLASTDSAPSVLCSAATVMWQWNALVRGENLTGKHFNQPPDGPYGSWYGHHKAPLDDPFAVIEQNKLLRSDELSESGLDSKLRPIPKAVTKYIRHVLSLYPHGITLTQLRNELTQSNFALDKDLYGYKKFSRFLLAMPHVLQLQSGNDGQICVRGVNRKSCDAGEPATTVGESEMGIAPNLNGERSCSDHVAEKSPVTPILEPKMKDKLTHLQEAQKKENQDEFHPPAYTEEIKVQVPKKEMKRKESIRQANMQEMRERDEKVKLQQQLKKMEEVSLLVEIKDCLARDENQLHASGEHSSSAEFGIFKRIWMKWFGSSDTKCIEKSSHNVDEILTGKDNVEEQNLMSRQSAKSVFPALFSPSSHEALIDGKIPRSAAAVTYLSSHDSSLFHQIMNWCKFWGSPESDETAKKNCEKVDHMKANSKQPDIYSKESFWKEMASFIDAPEGSALFSQSNTREHLAQQLQEQGPSVLRSLTVGDLIHLISLLIYDKKWVEERDSPISPFKITRPAGRDLNSSHPLSSNGLSHMFTNGQPISREFGERKHQNPPHTGVPQGSCPRGSSSKLRNDILIDCRMLVDHILKEYPEGFNMGSFRKLFLEKHGYALDLKKLGYEKLVNLLQIMPGVRIESNLIIPSEEHKNPGPLTIDLPSKEIKIGPAANSDSESSDLSGKDDDSDSWNELGPINNSGTRKEETGSRTRKGQTKIREQSLTDYEPLEEDDFSDSEEETSSIGSESEFKSKMIEEDSSLLQILESWYSGNEGDSKKDELVNISNVTNTSENILQPSAHTVFDRKIDSPKVNHTRNKKPVKNYSFVKEPVNSNDKLVDGILGTLKKSVREPC